MDYPALYNGVKNALTKLKKGTKAGKFADEAHVARSLFHILRNMMVQCEIESVATDCRVFVVNASNKDNINACLDIPDHTTLTPVDSGYFGQVYMVDGDLVRSNISKKKTSKPKRYAVKIEPLNHEYWAQYKSAENPANVLCTATDLAKRAGKAGVGPKIHDSFVCDRGRGNSYFVTVMDYLEGSTMEKWRMCCIENETLLAKAQTIFDRRLDQLTSLGIQHNDLYNIKNIFVVHPRDRPTEFTDIKLIDYGISNEQKRLNDSIKQHFSESLGRMGASHPVLLVLRHLVADRVVKL